MQARSIILCAALCALGASSCKKGFGSGFEGEIAMHSTSAGGNTQDMTVEAKGDKLRIGVGNDSYTLVDSTTNKVTMVKDADKAYMDLDFSSKSAPQANTSADTAKIEMSGKHETIAGLDCEDWTAKDPSGKRSEVCLAQGIAFVDVSGSKSGLSKELREKKLFPLRSVEYDASGKELSRMEVTKVTKKSIDDSRFAVPKDYKKISLPGM